MACLSPSCEFLSNCGVGFLKLSFEDHYSKKGKRKICMFKHAQFAFCRLIKQLHVLSLHVVYPDNNTMLCQVCVTLVREAAPCSTRWVIGPITICGICCYICNLLMQVTLVVAVDNLNKCKLTKPEYRRTGYR